MFCLSPPDTLLRCSGLGWLPGRLSSTERPLPATAVSPQAALHRRPRTGEPSPPVQGRGGRGVRERLSNVVSPQRLSCLCLPLRFRGADCVVVCVR